MKIRKLHLKNIGVFDDESLEFQPCPAKDKAEIHILTGQNGSGKSTILMGLASTFYGWKEGWDTSEEEKVEKELQKNLPVNTERSLFKRFRFFDEDPGSGTGYKSFISVFTNESYDESYIDSQEEKPESEHSSSIGIDIYGVPKDYFGTNEIRSTTYSDSLEYYKLAVSSEEIPEVDYSVFAYSGYRFVKSERIELLKEYDENPLIGTLDFVKIYEGFTINQWLANNLSQRALAREENNKKNANRFDENVRNLAKIISEVVGFQVDFKLKYSPPQLVLKIEQEELDFDVLPDGLRSLLSWIGDLLMRVELLRWQENVSVFDRKIILFLDEIEVHLHPAWQRKVLPVVQKLFKNSQIFVSTHSPFVVNSIDDAWVYKLKLDNGKAKVAEIIRSEDGISYQTVLDEILGVSQEFGGKTQEDLDKFYKIVRNGKDINRADLLKLAKSLAVQSEELNSIVQIELRQLSRRKGKEFSL